MQRIALFGATSAIAEACARRFAADGAALFLVGRNAGRLAAVAADLRLRGAATVETAVADLADLDRHAELVAAAFRALGGLDAALLAQGSLPDQRACEDLPARAVPALALNYLSPVSLLGELAAALRDRPSAVLAVIGSVAGDRGRQSNYVYGSAKAGLAIFAEGLQHRLHGRGPAVILVKPGFVDTPMTAAFAKGGPLWASADRVAADIVAAMRRGRSATIYSPWFWRPILWLVRAVPAALFRRSRL